MSGYSGALRRLDRDLGDLLEHHDQARDLREFERWHDDPVGFVRDVLGGVPWSRQEEIAEAIRSNPLVAVRSCNASGKDWIAAHLALWWVYARRGLVLLTGPTERQVREVCMGEVARAFHRAKDLPGELFQLALRLGQGEQAGILAFTSTEASRLTGFHAPRVFAVLTEAQGCQDFAWESVLACATGSEDRVLAVGNPLSPSGRFYQVSRPRSSWAAIQISAEEHPNLQEGRVVIPGGPTPEFAARIATEYGRGSGIYRARVQGEFPDQGDEGLFRRSWIESAAKRWEEWRYTFAEEVPVVGVDPARFGPDLTVAAIRRGPVVEELLAWSQSDLMETVEKLRELLERAGVTPGECWTGDTLPVSWGKGDRLFGPRPLARPLARGTVIVDEVGLGSGVLDRLKELGFHAFGFNGGSSSADSERFANLRAESYWMLARRLEAGEVALPPDEPLTDELLAVRWRPTPEGKIRIEAKDDLRGRLGRSPDRADAVAMALWESAAREVAPPLVW